MNNVSVDAAAVVDVQRRQIADLSFQVSILTARAESAEQALSAALSSDQLPDDAEHQG